VVGACAQPDGAPSPAWERRRALPSLLPFLSRCVVPAMASRRRSLARPGAAWVCMGTCPPPAAALVGQGPLHRPGDRTEETQSQNGQVFKPFALATLGFFTFCKLCQVRLAGSGTCGDAMPWGSAVPQVPVTPRARRPLCGSRGAAKADPPRSTCIPQSRGCSLHVCCGVKFKGVTKWMLEKAGEIRWPE